MDDRKGWAVRDKVSERSRAAVAAAETRGKVRTNPPQARVLVLADTPEPGLGEKLFSYAEERKGTKAEVAPPPLRFVPEARDFKRLLPRLREATRR